MNTERLTPGTLQAELDQPLADLVLEDIPGGAVTVRCRSSYGVELRGERYNEDEGKWTWVGANVSVSPPEFQPWGDGGEIRPASINHSSSSTRGVPGDAETTIALLQLAVDLCNDLDAEAPVALAPAKAAWETARAKHEADCEAAKHLNERRAGQVREALGYYYDLRVTKVGRKQPYTGQAELDGFAIVVDGHKVPFAQIEKLERRVNDSKFGQFVPVDFPSA